MKVCKNISWLNWWKRKAFCIWRWAHNTWPAKLYLSSVWKLASLSKCAQEHFYFTKASKNNMMLLAALRNLQLKVMGISKSKLCLFYTANIRSVLEYCIRSFFILLNNSQKEAFEKIQILGTQIILPDEINYFYFLLISNLSVSELMMFSETRCLKLLLKDIHH